MTSSTEVPHSLSFEPRDQECADTPSVGPSPQPLTGAHVAGQGSECGSLEAWGRGVGDALTARSVKSSFLQVAAGLLVLGGSFQCGGLSHHPYLPRERSRLPVPGRRSRPSGGVCMRTCTPCLGQGCLRVGQRPVLKGTDGLLFASRPVVTYASSDWVSLVCFFL